jgi:DNA-binding PadR family transcriptional regulator
MSNLQKHRILQAINNNKKEKSLTLIGYTSLGLSLSNVQLHEKLNILMSDLSDLLNSLEYEGYIEHTSTPEKGKDTFYIITLKGITALSDYTFVWYRNFGNWMNLVSIGFAFVSLCISGYTLYYKLKTEPIQNIQEQKVKNTYTLQDSTNTKTYPN